MKIDWDLSLKGDALYYKNLEKWMEAHKDAEAIEYDREGTPTRAFYSMPTRFDFLAMKRIGNVIKRAGNNPQTSDMEEVKTIIGMAQDFNELIKD